MNAQRSSTVSGVVVATAAEAIARKEVALKKQGSDAILISLQQSRIY